MNSYKTILILLLVFLMSFTVGAQTFPLKNWERNLSPTFSGWNIDKLDELRSNIVDSSAITGFMIINDGKVVFEYGNLSENSYIASCRKSILSILYGKYVKNGTIDLKSNLKDLKLNTIDPLSDIESTATIKDLISARSGVYLPASNGGDMSELAPKRGSKLPGSFWLYSNWDFNMAGLIFEEVTTNNIYDEIGNQLASPLNMQDWDRSLQMKSGDYKFSDIQAYHMWFSTRDLARVGLLMLNQGKWNDEQLISKDWIMEMTSEHSSFEELNALDPRSAEYGGYFAYGYMWWLWRHPINKKMDGAYSALGAWGQTITVFPKINTVLVFKTKNEYERMSGNPYKIIESITECFDQNIQNEFKQLAFYLSENQIDAFTNHLELIDLTKFDTSNLQSALNRLGYSFLEKKQIDSAIDIFQSIVKIYPLSWNAYDSLGEAYFNAGSLEKAKNSYSKAKKLNANNEFGYNKNIEKIIVRIDHLLSKLK